MIQNKGKENGIQSLGLMFIKLYFYFSHTKYYVFLFSTYKFLKKRIRKLGVSLLR